PSLVGDASNRASLQLLTWFTRPSNYRYGSINRSYRAGYTEAHQRSWNQDRGTRYKKCGCAVQSAGNRKRCRTSRCCSGTHWPEGGPLVGKATVACDYNELLIQLLIAITLSTGGSQEMLQYLHCREGLDATNTYSSLSGLATFKGYLDALRPKSAQNAPHHSLRRNVDHCCLCFCSNRVNKGGMQTWCPFQL